MLARSPEKRKKKRTKAERAARREKKRLREEAAERVRISAREPFLLHTCRQEDLFFWKEKALD